MIYLNNQQFLQNQMKRSQRLFNVQMTKLGSGKRINMAADDAAGLSISQKMRAQIRGLSQATRNVQDATSMLQVAEGGMKEIMEIVQRMRELSVQASSDTLANEDQAVIQEEIDKMKQGIADIVYNTEFNTQKVLSNLEYGEFVMEPRQVNKLIGMPTSMNRSLVRVNQNNHTTTTGYFPTENISYQPVFSDNDHTTNGYYQETGSTVIDYRPRYSVDGEHIVFQSSRDNLTYMVGKGGSSTTEVYDDRGLDTQRLISSDGLAKVEQTGTSLRLYFRENTSNSWSYYQTISDYNYLQDGGNGFSFSPVTDDNGNTSFVYSDSNYNIKQVHINTKGRMLLSSEEVISTNDRTNLPAENQTIRLGRTPKLYRMNEINASLIVEKVTDSGSRQLTYWNGEGDPPSNGYYTVNGNQISFHGDTIIGNQAEDDAQDYYRFTFASSTGSQDMYQHSLPSNADIYHMDGSDGPRSLDIFVGGRQVGREDLLSERPSNPEENGVFVNASTGYVEFYGDWRPGHNESIRIEYIKDIARDSAYTHRIPSGIDLYNLTDSDPNSNRSLRVYVGGQEIFHDEDNGFTYDRTTGILKIHGDARPDKPSGDSVEIRYFADASHSDTDDQTVGIPLNTRYPELYNLDTNDGPSSIKVLRNGREEVPFSNTDGYQYNKDTNTIELFGSARPDVGDSYTIKFVQDSYAIREQNGIVEISLNQIPELYLDEQTGEPLTLEVTIDGNKVNYDETKQNGYFYNREKNAVEIYGNARPGVDDQLQINYVLEATTHTHDNNSYDIMLNPTPADYGVISQDSPKAMSVYYKGNEVPYDSEHGFTYDSASHTISLHGDYRPKAGDTRGDLEIYSISPSMLEQTIPTDHRVFEVRLNGDVIPPASENNGNGYLLEDGRVTIVGTARPTIDRNTGTIQLEIDHHQSTAITLNTNSIILDPITGDYMETPILASDIDPDSIVVKLNQHVLDPEWYQLEDNRITFSNELPLTRGNNQITVDYDLRHAQGYQSNEYTYQVGANQGQQVTMEIRSFENLLAQMAPYQVLTRESANHSISLADALIAFVSSEQSKIGAMQNRLESIASNLSIAEENLMSSSSRIEDADMAKEIMGYTKQQLLRQVQQSIQLHQYQQGESVLKLL